MASIGVGRLCAATRGGWPHVSHALRRLVVGCAQVVANFGKSSGMSVENEEDEEAIPDLDVDDIQIDEATLPRLDTEDPETVALEQEHDDLLDRRWLDQPVMDEDGEERSALDDLGVTIELNASGAEDEAEEVDLDIGDLLEPLPGDGTDGDPSLGHERADGAFGIAALRDMLLPESEEEHDERDVGDDDRFPVFDAGAPAWRPARGDDEAPDESPEGEPS